MEELILLVDKKDNPSGYLEKIKAHQNGGTLHRAFSLFIYNSNGEMMLQKRAKQKYHFGDLWTNTCCSHQRDTDKTLEAAAHRRIKEEMGFDTELVEIFSMIYQADFENGLSEYEFDHIYAGIYDEKPNINSDEASEYKLIKLNELKEDIIKNPKTYTPWFKYALTKKKKALMDSEKVKDLYDRLNHV